MQGWLEERGSHDRWLQAVLNNVVYYTNEPPDPALNESDYSLPDQQDKVDWEPFLDSDMITI